MRFSDWTDDGKTVKPRAQQTITVPESGTRLGPAKHYVTDSGIDLGVRREVLSEGVFDREPFPTSSLGLTVDLSFAVKGCVNCHGPIPAGVKIDSGGMGRVCSETCRVAARTFMSGFLSR